MTKNNKKPKVRNPIMTMLVKESCPGGSHKLKNKVLPRKVKHKKDTAL